MIVTIPFTVSRRITFRRPMTHEELNDCRPGDVIFIEGVAWVVIRRLPYHLEIVPGTSDGGILPLGIKIDELLNWHRACRDVVLDY